MPIKVTCPGCQKSLQVADTARGKRVRCPRCKQTLTAEPAAPPADDAPAPAADKRKKKSALPAVLIGCGVLALLGVVIGSVGGWYAWKKIRNAADEARQRVEANEQQIRQELEKANQNNPRAAQPADGRPKESPADPKNPRPVQPADDGTKAPPPPEPEEPEQEEVIRPGAKAPPAPPAADVVQPMSRGIELDANFRRFNFIRWCERGRNRVVVGKTVLGSNKLRVQQYDTVSGQKLGQVDLPAQQFAPAFSLSPDGQYLLTLSALDRSAPPKRSVWSLTDGKPLVDNWAPAAPPGRPARRQDAEFASELLSGRRLLGVYGSGRVVVWQLPEAAGQPPRQTAVFEPPADVARYTHQRFPFPMALAPDGSRLAYFNGSDGFVVLDTASLKLQGVLKSPEDACTEVHVRNTARGVAFSPDGSQLAAYFDADSPFARDDKAPPVKNPRPPVLVRWDVQSKRRLARFDDPTPGTTCLAISWWGPDYCWVSKADSGYQLLSWEKPRVVLRVDIPGQHAGTPQWNTPDGKFWLLFSEPSGKGALKSVDLPAEALKTADKPLRLTYHGIVRK